MFFHRSLTRIIEKGLKKSVDEISDCTPRYVDYFYYGAYDTNPRHLVIWFIFDTDNDLEEARNSGLCDRITSVVITDLISEGYPKEAFNALKNDVNTEIIKFVDNTQEQAQNIMNSFSHSCGRVCFTSKEDIDNKANGDYHLYFQ